MSVSMEKIKELRARTGAGMLDVKNVLVETDGNVDKAAELLRERGVAKAAKKADREAKEGFIGSYVHHNGKIAVIVELNCETDFVARNETFQELAKNIAIHIAMAAPQAVSRDQVDPALAEAERDALRKEALAEGKPEAIVDKMVEGRMGKFFAEICLLEQPYVKDDKMTVEELLKESIATIGENIQVGAFHRIAIGS